MTAPDLTPAEAAEVDRFGIHYPEQFDAFDAQFGPVRS